MSRHLALLAMALFLARGIALLCVLPPGEGWDEYQHLAYVEIMAEGGGRPVVRESRVPRDLFQAMAPLPQTREMLAQTPGTGARGYAAHWSSGEPASYRSDHADVVLYQAQHGSLYYRLAAPLVEASAETADVVAAFARLRLVNLLLAALGLGVLFRWLEALPLPPRHRGLLVLAVASQPLLLLDVVRVGNAALGLALGIVFVCALGTPRVRETLPGAVAAGALGGLAALAKTTNLALLLLGLIVALVSRDPARTARRRWLFAYAGIAALVLAPSILSSLVSYGVPTPMQEAVANHRAGLGLADLAGAISRWPWGERLLSLWLSDALWVGGWSMLALPNLIPKLWGGLLILGVVSSALFGFAGGDGRGRSTLALAWGAWGFVNLGLLYHMAQSQLAWGAPTTNAWYACVAFPFVLLIAFVGFARWGAVGLVPALALPIVQLVAEQIGIANEMLPRYADTENFRLALERLAMLQPGWLGTWTFVVAQVAAFASFGSIAVSALRGRTA